LFEKARSALLTLTACLAANPARAAAPLVAAYHASWAGLPAADIEISLDEDADHYRDWIAIRSKGVPRWFTSFTGSAVSEGALAADGAAAPRRYDALYSLRKRKNNHISMRVSARESGTIIERGPEDTSRKPPLAEIYRRNVLDPLTAVTVIRQTLRTKPRAVGTEFSMPIYDGSRRFDVLWHILPAETTGDGILRIELWLHPIAGFKGETSEDGDPDDAPRKVELQITDDDRLLALYMRVSVAYLPLVVRFDHLCRAQGECGD
jgi:hypothetical protein